MENPNRAAYRGQVTRVVNSVNDFLKTAESQPNSANEESWGAIEEELTVFLQRLKSAHEGLQRANPLVPPSVKPDEQVKDSEAVVEYEDKAVAAIARLEQRLARLNRMQQAICIPAQSAGTTAHSSPAREHHNGVSLPKLPLKMFSGDYKEWLPYWEQFKAAVHDNDSLSGADKFNYLLSTLKSTAADTVAGFTPSEKCYDGAIALLQEEFGNSDKLIDKNMNEMMSLSAISSKTDVRGLKSLYYTVTSSIRSLTALGIPSSHYSIMLKSKLIRCLPSELRANYFRLERSDEEECGESSTATGGGSSESECSFVLDGEKNITNLLKFIKREIVALENSLEDIEPKHHRQPKSFSTAAGLLTAAHEHELCFFCKSSNHATRNCDSSHTLAQRKNMLKDDSRCFRCTSHGHSAKKCVLSRLRCPLCSGWHAKAMHDTNYHQQQSANTITIEPTQATNLCAVEKAKNNNANVFLQSASVFAFNTNGSDSAYVRIIFDGGSQLTFVKESLAEKLSLRVVGYRNICVIPFGNEQCLTRDKKCKIVRLALQSQYVHSKMEIDAIVVPEICPDILEVPTENITRNLLVNLADARPFNYQPEAGISLLIGADNYWRFVTGNLKRISDRLVATETLFGWTLQGPSCACTQNVQSTSASVLSVSAFDETSFWNLETIGIKPAMDESSSFTDEYSANCITRGKERYRVKLPWKRQSLNLDSNQVGAFSRFRSLTRKLSRKPSELLRYDAAIWELVGGGIVEKVDAELEGERIYYMPHRGVYREEKSTSKLRIVFDASAHTENRASLNDELHSGSNLLADILKLLLNFRLGNIGMVADIEKAFLQIELDERDRDAHRFFWFANPIASVDQLPSYQIFRMTRVTFGVTSSPFILGATLKKHITALTHRYPKACAILLNSAYMDDFVFSLNNVEEAKEIHSQSNRILKSASMNLRKWNSSHQSVRSFFSEVPPDQQKVLGVSWFVQTDELMVDLKSALNIDVVLKARPTKRCVLQVISRIFDPFGVLGPFVIKFKILFQNIWKLKIGWDEVLPADLLKMWNVLYPDLEELKEFTIPRCALVGRCEDQPELHVFADASQNGYGAVAYVRMLDKEGKPHVRFLCARNRVAPLKTDSSDNLTLPRLELTAALIAARLCSYLINNLKVKFRSIHLWTDSKITLCWIQNDKKFKPYVANRVEEIRKLTAVKHWHHCPGKENPADLLTRGITASALLSSDLWKSGASWLQCDPVEWPKDSQEEMDDTLLALHVDAIDSENLPAQDLIFQPNRYSCWKRMLRVTSYVVRFTEFIQRRKLHLKDLPISAEEILSSEEIWLRYAQLSDFENEIRALRKLVPIDKSSSLLTLNPFLDERGLLRVNSRLSNSQDQNINPFPIILPKRSPITKLIVTDYHSQMMHGGTNTTLAGLRNKFWIIGGRQLIKTVIAECRICKLLRSTPGWQPFAPLPRDRIYSSRPFEITGIDYAGPLYIRDSLVEGSTKKAYVLLLTCGTIRAVHLELVMDLTTEGCLMALRRFFARRGRPRIIYSDNAKTFKCASKELSNFYNAIQSQVVQGFVGNEGIRWKYIIERAPWWGGFWERLVRSIKTVLKKAIGKAVLDFEQLRTLLTEVESVINARPLTYISDDPTDLSPLTPSHFLTVCFHGSGSLEPDATTTHQDLQQKWQLRLKALTCFWKRWRVEYLQQLRSLHHWKNGNGSCFKVNDVVILQDPALPKTFWKLALIEDVFIGRDNKVRACQIRLANGTKLRRPVQLLCPLEVN